MKTGWIVTLSVVLLTLASLAAPAAGTSGFDVAVLVNGSPRPEYSANGRVYVEALRGSDYALRITNPLPCRIAVALSVDGLNTIDARHTSAALARKWVLEPYESVVISGWQVNGSEARRFTFTGEKHSYGALLGQTDNLGIVEAVFFRERIRPILHREEAPTLERDSSQAPSGKDAGGVSGAPAAPQAESKCAPRLSDEYAATGMGDKVGHEVTWVAMELEKTPAATVSIRYEYRPQLVRLGVLPQPRNPLNRREGARGFEGPYCPDPYAIDP